MRLLGYPGRLLRCCSMVAKAHSWLLGCCYAVARVPREVKVLLYGC